MKLQVVLKNLIQIRGLTLIFKINTNTSLASAKTHHFSQNTRTRKGEICSKFAFKTMLYVHWPEKSLDPLLLLGSLTAFNKLVTNSKQCKSVIKYMPVISESPSFSVCKHYLNVLNNIITDLGLGLIISNAHEDLYAKVVQIIWKHGSMYENIISIIAVFVKS